ncbi:MAG: HNH endonuclease family protein [bacterium]
MRDLTDFPRRSYWLRRLENHGRKERVPVDEYTIEHTSSAKRESAAEVAGRESDPDWQRVQESWLHTPGNLTLTGYNAEYSDRPFSEKRDMKGGFRESPLKLNEGLSGLDKWDEAAIKNRAERLAAVATGVWAVLFFRKPKCSSCTVRAARKQRATRSMTIRSSRSVRPCASYSRSFVRKFWRSTPASRRSF